MSDAVLIAVIGAGGTFLTAVVALIVNYRGFASLDGRMLALENRFDSRLASLENRLDRDIKDLTGAVNELDKRLTRVEDKLGIQP